MLLLDDLGDWRGIGTAMFLQEAGCQVTLVTSAAAVATGLFHSAADEPTRRRFARSGGETSPSTVVVSWQPGVAVLRSTLTGDERRPHPTGSCVAETAVPRTELSAELARLGVAHHSIGDCVAARRASLAIYEGRRLASRCSSESVPREFRGDSADSATGLREKACGAPRRSPYSPRPPDSTRRFRRSGG